MSSAEPNHVEHQAVIQYLLGAATEAQTDLFDRMSIADEDFAHRLKALEDDLIDGYVRGELSGETLERFRASYLSSPMRREKVRFAEALLPLADQHVPAVVRRSPLVFPRLVLAAAASLLLAAGAYWMFENSRPAPRVQSKTAVAPPQTAPAAPGPLASMLFVLAPPTRGGAALPVLSLPTGVGSVTFRLELEENDSRFYRAVLKDLAVSQPAWRSENRPAEVVQGVPSVILIVPAVLLKKGSYSLELAGISATGAAETIGAYAFRVVAK